MLEHSYKKVISVNNVEDGTYINYGPYTSGQYYAPNNVLVIGVRFDPEYDKETTDIIITKMNGMRIMINKNNW